MTTTTTPERVITREILEDRYDGLLEVLTRQDRPFTDSQPGDVNRRWRKLTAMLDDLIQGTARDADADERGAILEACLVSIREHVITGILEAQR